MLSLLRTTSTLSMLLLALTATAYGQGITVTTAHDAVDGNTASISQLLAAPGGDGLISLREAISAANNTPGGDQIRFALSLDGTPIVLDIGSTHEDANLDGDLDITDIGGLTLIGNGPSATILDGGGTERVLDHHEGNLAIRNLTIRNGRAASRTDFEGGGLRSVPSQSAVLELTDCAVTSNESSFEGGGLFASSDFLIGVTLTRCSFTHNTSGGVGGSVYLNASSQSQISITDSAFDQNIGDSAGALFVAQGTAFIVGSTFTNNQADGNGGAVYFNSNEGNLTITHSSIVGNTMSNSGSGGGVYINAHRGETNITHSIIANNLSTGNGGGLTFNSTYGRLRMTNTTVSGNRARSDGGGLAHSATGGTVDLHFVTLTNNTADYDADGQGDGGGLVNRFSGKIINLENSIVFGNDDASPGQTGTQDCAALYNGNLPISLGGNVFGTNTGCDAIGPDDLTTHDARLAQLQDGIHALLEGSPAQGRTAQGTRGCGTTVTSDQRGSRRAILGRCDSGAYETYIATADLALAAKAEAKGAEATLFFTLANQSPAESAKATVKAKLPQDLLFVRASGDGSYDRDSGRWKPGRLAAGQQAVLQLTVRRLSGQQQTVTARITKASLPDGNAANNSATITLEGTTPPPASGGQQNLSDASGRLGAQGQGLHTTGGVPQTVSLDQNYPNPFNPETTIPFALPASADVHLAVYDLLGRQVALLVDGTLAAGAHEARFQADNLPTGMYLVRLQAGSVTHTQRVTLLK